MCFFHHQGTRFWVNIELVTPSDVLPIISTLTGNQTKSIRLIKIVHSQVMTWMFPKIVVPPNHPMFNRVFHYFHHPFWGKIPYFWKAPTSTSCCVCLKNMSLETLSIAGVQAPLGFWDPAGLSADGDAKEFGGDLTTSNCWHPWGSVYRSQVSLSNLLTSRRQSITRWWFHFFKIFIPSFGEDDPILTSAYFPKGVGSTTN